MMDLREKLFCSLSNNRPHRATKFGGGWIFLKKFLNSFTYSFTYDIFSEE